MKIKVNEIIKDIIIKELSEKGYFAEVKIIFHNNNRFFDSDCTIIIEEKNLVSKHLFKKDELIDLVDLVNRYEEIREANPKLLRA